MPPQRTPLRSLANNNVPHMHLSPYDRGKIIGRLEGGDKVGVVAKAYNLPHSTVVYTQRQDQLRDDGTSLLRKARKKSYSDGDERLLLRYIRLFPKSTYTETKKACGLNCSITTIKRVLKIHGISNWKARKRPELTEKHAIKRLAWCLARRGWTAEEWGLTFWSDECSAERGQGKKQEWVFRSPRQKWDRNMVQTYSCGKNMRVMV